MALRYESIQPESVKSAYTEFDTLDYVITAPGRAIVSNSVRLEGDLRVQKSGANLTLADDVKIDPQTGAHAFIESLTLDTKANGNVENITEYARWAAMKTKAQQTREDMFNATAVCELKTPDEKVSRALLRGIPTSTSGTTVNDNNDFSIRLHTILNNVASDNKAISVARMGGEIRLSIRLARVFNALYGNDVDANVTYSLSDVRLSFATVPDDPAAANMGYVFRSVVALKQNINSSFVNVASKVPAIATGVSATFLEQSREGSAVYNNQALELLPNQSQLQFLFNDSQNEAIAYVINDRAEVLHRYVDSLRSGGANAASLQNVNANQDYGVGLSFGEVVDLRGQKFNVQLQSGADSGTPYQIFMYFHALVEL